MKNNKIQNQENNINSTINPKANNQETNNQASSKISKNVLNLSIASLLNDASSEIIMPILPLFIKSLGGASIAIGLIGGIRDSVASLLKLFSGYISDITGKKKPLVFSGYFLSAILKFLLAFANTWQTIFTLIGLERIGKGLRDAPRDAIIAQSMPKNRGQGFGFHRAFDNIGAIIGSILAFILFWIFGLSFKTIIFISGVIAFFSVIPVLFVQEPKTQKELEIQSEFSTKKELANQQLKEQTTKTYEQKTQDQNKSVRLSLWQMPKNLKIFLLISATFSMANFSYMFFILKAQDLFTINSNYLTEGQNTTLSQYATGVAIALYILFNIFYALFSVPFGKLSDKIGRKQVLIFGYSLFAITALGFALLHSIFFYTILFISYGLANAAIEANQKAFVSDLSHEGNYGTNLGAYHTINGIVALPASLIAGILWKISPQLTFFYCSGLATLAVILFLALRKKM